MLRQREKNHHRKPGATCYEVNFLCLMIWFPALPLTRPRHAIDTNTEVESHASLAGNTEV